MVEKRTVGSSAIDITPLVPWMSVHYEGEMNFLCSGGVKLK